MEFHMSVSGSLKCCELQLLRYQVPLYSCFRVTLFFVSSVLNSFFKKDIPPFQWKGTNAKVLNTEENIMKRYKGLHLLYSSTGHNLWLESQKKKKKKKTDEKSWKGPDVKDLNREDDACHWDFEPCVTTHRKSHPSTFNGSEYFYFMCVYIIV